ncbi:MAG: orotidine-5'-phosphate decarboxylase, partial [Actinobacteria bacterium]|nr:orotidine-5'-phosphate decarboxylase [Actinomycetota bacterium]
MAEETLTPTVEELRTQLALAFDVDDMVVALRLARELQPWFGVAKVGLELFTAAGPDAVTALADLGYDVFLDLKMHDIPTTVGRAAAVVGAYGVRYLTLHASGGTSMLRAGVEGLHRGASRAGLELPVALAVTVLTSDAHAPSHIVPKRVQIALEAGCGGLVCGAPDVADVRQLAPRLMVVVPGTRPPGADAHDQARTDTPAAALAAGADLLVVGRVVTAAPDRAAAAAALGGARPARSRARGGRTGAGARAAIRALGGRAAHRRRAGRTRTVPGARR